VRARLEAASTRAQKKKGFMTPERKKKLRVSLVLALASNQSPAEILILFCANANLTLYLTRLC